MVLFPQITAHSGCMGSPDNTIQSVELGMSHGADIIEVDVLVTADGIPVLSHNDNIFLADGSECYISELSSEELDKLDLKVPNGAEDQVMRIVHLDSLLPYFQKSAFLLNVDLKSDACVEPVSKWLEEHQLLEQVILSGCEMDRACLVQRVNPRVHKLLNVDASIFVGNVYTDVVQSCCEDAKRAVCFGLNLDFRHVRVELLQIAADYMLDVYIWTVDEEIHMKHFIEIGVQSITTRNVSGMKLLSKEWR